MIVLRQTILTLAAALLAMPAHAQTVRTGAIVGQAARRWAR